MNQAMLYSTLLSEKDDKNLAKVVLLTLFSCLDVDLWLFKRGLNVEEDAPI